MNLTIEGGGALAIQSSVGGNNRTSLNNKTWNFDNGGGTLTFNGGNHLFQGCRDLPTTSMSPPPARAVASRASTAAS